MQTQTNVIIAIAQDLAEMDTHLADPYLDDYTGELEQQFKRVEAIIASAEKIKARILEPLKRAL